MFMSRLSQPPAVEVTLQQRIQGFSTLVAHPSSRHTNGGLNMSVTSLFVDDRNRNDDASDADENLPNITQIDVRREKSPRIVTTGYHRQSHAVIDYVEQKQALCRWPMSDGSMFMMQKHQGASNPCLTWPTPFSGRVCSLHFNSMSLGLSRLT